jgi:hypothetical protein
VPEPTPAGAATPIPAHVEVTGDHWHVLAPIGRIQKELPGFSCQEFGAK